MNNQYLPLTEYSTKHKVSISTLRRRIKTDDINFVFKDGKYLILDEDVSTHQRVHRPSQKISEETLMSAHVDTPQMNFADQLLGELKKAYSQILSEKEDQILHLKEELADLKTLVRVLESENERLAGQIKI